MPTHRECHVDNPRGARVSQPKPKLPDRRPGQERSYRLPGDWARQTREERQKRVAEQEQRWGDHHEQQMLNHMDLQKEIGEAVERGGDCDKESEQSTDETNHTPAFESMGHQTAQLQPASEIQ